MLVRRSKSLPSLTFSLVVLLALGALGAGCEESKTLTISGVEPKKGKYLGGDRVQILGTGFRTMGVKIYFGGRPATNCSVDSSTAITCETPASAGGVKDALVDVEIIFDDSKGKKLEKAFTYYDPIGTGPTNTVPTTAPKSP
jgi:hypothetical protein